MGGAERLAVEAAWQPPPGWQVELIALQPCGSGLEQRARIELGDRLTILNMRHLADLGQWRQLEREVRRRRPALMHAHLRYAAIWSAALARRTAIPLVITQHVLPGRRDWRALAERGALRQARLQLYVSAAQRRAWDPPQTERTAVLPNGVGGAAPWNPAQRRRWRNEHGFTDAPLLLTVAVLRRGKGWQDWLRAAESLHQSRPRLQWTWVGDGPEAAQLRAAVSLSPARAAIHLAGTRDDVSDWLRAADVFVFPSHGEAQPTAVLEAMAHRLPVIATDLPATREVLADSAALVPAHSAAALVRAVEQFLAEPQAAGAAAVRAHRRWQQHYSPNAWRARLVESYGRVTSTRASRLLMVEFFGRGGLYHYSRQMAQGLATAGGKAWAVTLLTGRHREVEEKSAAPPAPRVLPRLVTWNPHAQPRGWPRTWVRAARGLLYATAWVQVLTHAWRLRPDVVLLGDLEHRGDAWFLRLLRRSGGARLACIWHNLDAFERRRAGPATRSQKWRDRMARHFTHVLVHGAGLARDFNARTGLRPHPIVHGNQQWIAEQAGVDPQLDQRWALPRGRKLGLLFGTLSPYKGVDVLLQALALVNPEQRPLLLIAGMPTPAVSPADWLGVERSLGLTEWLRWDLRYVPTPEIAWYFRRADFAVLPYIAGSQSGVAHLALTFGKPLIVSDVGALPELIDGNGVVVPANHPKALAQAMAQLCQDNELRLGMGRRSAELAATRHDWNRIAEEVLRVVGA